VTLATCRATGRGEDHQVKGVHHHPDHYRRCPSAPPPLPLLHRLPLPHLPTRYHDEHLSTSSPLREVSLRRRLQHPASRGRSSPPPSLHRHQHLHLLRNRSNCRRCRSPSVARWTSASPQAQATSETLLPYRPPSTASPRRRLGPALARLCRDQDLGRSHPRRFDLCLRRSRRPEDRLESSQDDRA
jgi:hypothetical protein